MSDEKPFVEAWLAFDIGCIKCDEASTVVGIYETMTDAAANMKDAEDKQNARWHIRHHFEAFNVSSEVSVFARKAAAKALRDAIESLQDGWKVNEVVGATAAVERLRARLAALEGGAS